MVNNKEIINQYVNDYCKLRNRQNAVYSIYAKKFNLTTIELFVLDILWFEENECTQKMICERLSINKQTISSIINKFIKLGYFSFEEVETDKRNKKIVFTKEGYEYTKQIIPPAAEAENIAMGNLIFSQIEELVKLTTLFTENMEKEFNAIKEVK